MAIVGAAANGVDQRLAAAAGLAALGSAVAVEQAAAVLAEVVLELDEAATVELADVRTALATHLVAISALQSAGAAPAAVARLVGRAVDAVSEGPKSRQ